MTGKYVMSLDQGTTSSRCIIYNKTGEQVGTAQKEFTQIYPKAGWVEHDPMEIWETQLAVAIDALKTAGLTASDIDSIGITNQRETTIVWNKKTGEPVYNAIVWQCRRTAEFCDELKSEGLTEIYREKTGLIIDPYFSGTKLHWILENVSGARAKAESGDLIFGTVETWLIWKLTGGKAHVTDYSNASRTMLFNIRELKWDKEILDRLDIPEIMLPEPCSSSMIYGESLAEFFDEPIKIAGAAGDQQAALFGQTCFAEGEAKNTYGTGGFMLINTGDKIVNSKNGLLSTIAWGIDGKVFYALEGGVFVSGAVIQWLRDELKVITKSSETEEIALSIDDTAGVYVVPAFTGLGAPYWDPYARGSILGLTRGANYKHIVRAALESMAYQAYDLQEAMTEDIGASLKTFKVDGGASANNFLLQFQANLLNQPVYRPSCIETTSLGAAYLAGLATGFWKDQDEILSNWQLDRRFLPKEEGTNREDLLKGWHNAVNTTLEWAKDA